MFLIIFCLLQTIVSQQSTGGVNTIMNTTYTTRWEELPLEQNVENYI